MRVSGAGLHNIMRIKSEKAEEARAFIRNMK